MHPLHNVFHKWAHRYIKLHHSLLHELPEAFNISPKTIETWQPVCVLPTKELWSRVHSTAWEDDDGGLEGTGGLLQPELGVAQLYSDGSGLDGQIGAVVAMFKWDEEPRVVRFHLGSIADHTVYEAELAGLLLALHLLQNEQSVTRAVIRLDNQAVLYVLEACESGPAQSIIDQIISQIELIAGAESVPTRNCMGQGTCRECGQQKG